MLNAFLLYYEMCRKLCISSSSW